MLRDNLKLLLQLYLSPRAALSGIIDRGSFLFAAAAVFGVSVLMQMALLPGQTAALAQAMPRQQAAVWSLAFSLASSNLWSLFGLIVLYAPTVLLFVTLLEPVGSFGVAFRRDFGPLVVCLLMCWAAARLPFALAAAALGLLPGQALLAGAGLWLGGGLYFIVLAAFAVRTLFGVRRSSALGTAALAPVAYVLTPFLPLLASPCLLFYAYAFFRGDVSWSLSARQGFRRHLEAATLNPRDADAHYQLGLIHQHRRQIPEAVARFEKAVEIDAAELGAHYQLGRIAREQKRHADAIRHFEAVVARDDRFAQHEVWREIGGTYLESASFEHARWALDKYVGQRQHDPEGLCLLGEALAGLGQSDAARRALSAAVEAADTAPGYRRRELARWRRRAAQRLAGLSASAGHAS